MTSTSISPQAHHNIASMRPGDHYCGIYRNDDDHRVLICDFVRHGIERHEKIVYIVNVQTAAHLRATLQEAGIDADKLIESGQFVILTAKDAYLKDGEFTPDKMIALLRAETEKALAEGYAALRATGEMTWALAGEPGSERLIEYESLLNEFFPDKKCYAVCQYDQRRFDSEMMLDILHTHPSVLFGQKCFDNSRMYYVPPQRFLSSDRQSAVLDRWLDNLSFQKADGAKR